MRKFALLLLTVCWFPAYALDATSELTLTMDGFKKLAGEEIRTLLTGKTVLMTYGRENDETVYFYGDDGVRSSVVGGRRLDRYWTVSSDMLCEEYLRPYDYACAAVFKKADTIQLCPEEENICWYILSNFHNGDKTGIRTRKQSLPE